MLEINKLLIRSSCVFTNFVWKAIRLWVAVEFILRYITATKLVRNEPYTPEHSSNNFFILRHAL